MMKRAIDLDAVTPYVDGYEGGWYGVGNGDTWAYLPFACTDVWAARESVEAVLRVRLAGDYEEDPDDMDGVAACVARDMSCKVVDLWTSARRNSAADLLALMCDRWAADMGGQRSDFCD